MNEDDIDRLLRESVTVVAERIYPQGEWQTGQYGIAEVTVQNGSEYELRDVELQFDVPGQFVTAVKFVMFEASFDDTWRWSLIGPGGGEKAYFWLQTLPAENRAFPVEIFINLVATLRATVVVPLEGVTSDYAASFDQITLV